PVFVETRAKLFAAYPDVRAGLAPVEAVAALPLDGESGVIGSIGYSFAEPHAFDADERTFLLTLASHAVLALERNRHRREQEIARQRLTILADVSKRFSETSLDVRRVMDTVVFEVATRVRDS